MDIAVPAENCVKLKESEKRDKLGGKGDALGIGQEIKYNQLAKRKIITKFS